MVRRETWRDGFDRVDNVSALVNYILRRYKPRNHPLRIEQVSNWLRNYGQRKFAANTPHASFDRLNLQVTNPD